MKSIYILGFILSFVSVNAKAVESGSIDSLAKKISVHFLVGTKIGGATPLSIPEEIREIKSYTPALPFFASARAEYQIDRKWGVLLGLTFEGKGMNTAARVKGYKTTFNDRDSEESMRGYYTGDITTNVQNLYLSIPVQATFRISDRWDVQAGPYVAFAVRKKFFGEATEGYMRSETPTGTKILVEAERYNFADNVRNIDVGASVGGRFSFGTQAKYYALAQADYGFNNIMKQGFESISFGLHNVFLNVGVGIKL